MDNLTHTLFGLTLAQTPLRRSGPGVTAALVLASNAPDIDIVKAVLDGSLSYLDAHRGPTHGPLGLLSLALATASLVRFFRPAGNLRKLFIVSFVGVLGHILMDIPTSYGTRIFSPFSSTWYAFDWLPIIDVYLWVALAAGLSVVAFRPRWRNRAVAAILVVMAGNYALRAATHRLALAPYDGQQDRRCDVSPLRSWGPEIGRPELTCGSAAAVPTFTSPFRWRIVRKVPGAYELSETDVLTKQTGTPIRFPDVRTPATDVSLDSATVKVFLSFARFPAARADPARNGDAVVYWTDMRFARGIFALDPDSIGPRTPFVVRVRLRPDGSIVEQYPAATGVE